VTSSRSKPDGGAVDPALLAQEVERLHWYHTLELAPGVITPGMFDHRPMVDSYLLPRSLEGLRCLDVGTMDGFWAFELERRGAAEVVALDLGDPEQLDWPPAYRQRIGEPVIDATKADRFELAKRALGSHVHRELRSVYELDADLGSFDLVFCGDLLSHLRDPVGALARIRQVCRRTAIIANPIVRFRWRPRRPLARFDGIDQWQWWELSGAAIERMMLAVGFAQVVAGSPFELPSTAGGRWRGLRGVFRGEV
jgi:tRNA (mo5U34)-methyltransferase